MSRFVLDASVVLTWCFPDEDAALADQVVNLFKQGHTAVVPAFWPHEVLNALLFGERRKRISKEMAQRFLAELATLPIDLQTVRIETVFDRIESLSRKHRLTAYDAAYLDVALEGRLPLATLDEALINASRAAGVGLVCH